METVKIVSVGFAMFAMLFGAGNAIFPLVLGRDVGTNLWFGLAGFVIAAVVFPLIGLISTMLCGGDFKKMLNKLGRIPGKIVTFIFMVILGPFAITPRTVTVAHASIKLYLPAFNIFYFGIFASIIIFACTFRKSRVMDILGKFLGPIQLLLLFAVIVKGLLFPTALIASTVSAGESFWIGLITAYGTADVLGAIFFSGLILAGLMSGVVDKNSINPHKLALMGFQAGAFGALLLALVYAGFCIVAAFNGAALIGVEDGDIFSTLTNIVLGGSVGFIANMAVAVSCLTTAIALTTVFANYVSNELLKGIVSYRFALLITVIITATVSNLGFGGIMKIVGPIIEAIYPALIVLSVVNIFNELFGFRWIKAPVFLTFIATMTVNYWGCIQSFIG